MYAMKKTAVEMGDVIKKMREHMPEGLLGHYIFLPAYMAIASLYGRAAIQAILFLSLGDVGHCKYFLKNKYKKYKAAFFFVPL